MDQDRDLGNALESAQKQGLVSIYGIERDTRIARSTVRRVIRGKGRPNPATEQILWAYLREKGVV